MPIQVLMPALSPTMEKGNLAKWLKKEGDAVKSGDVLAEIETDKATMEVEAVDEGTLGKILVPGGTDAVKVNTPIAVILDEGEDASAIKTAPASAEKAPAAKTAEAKPAAAPVTADVEAAIAGGGAKAAPAARPAPAPTQAAAVAGPTPHHVVPHTTMRKVIAKRLTESKQTVPHFYLTVDCEIDALLKGRAALN